MPKPLARSVAGRLAGIAALAWTALVSASGTVLAQAHDGDAAHVTEGAAEHAAGLPQLDPSTFAPQLVWLAISFAVLYFLMSRVALPRVGQILEERQERISGDLDRAQALRDEADNVQASYESALAEARAQAQAVIAAASAEIAAAQAARNAQFAAELTNRTKAAEERIAAAKEQALTNVRAVAADIAQAAAEKLAGIQIDTATAEAAVTDATRRRA